MHTSSSPDLPSFEIVFGRNGNDSDFLRQGWSGSEPGQRWAIGPECVIEIPTREIHQSFFLTFVLAPWQSPSGLQQRLAILVNDFRLRTIDLFTGRNEYTVLIPRQLLFPSRPTSLRFQFRYHATDADCNETPGRNFASAFYRLTFAIAAFEPAAYAVTLPALSGKEFDASERKKLAECFHSLGQNCEFGVWQRQCQAEPLGLLRFASIRIPHLIYGLRHSFDGIDDPDQFELRCAKSNDEYMGHHSFYGLDYHTFRTPAEVRLDSFYPKERARLRYLVRHLMDELVEGDKVFVVQSADPAITEEIVLPLYLTLKSFCASIRLLYVTQLGSDFPAARNRVEFRFPGLYRARIARFAPAENAHALDFDAWLQICATIAAHTAILRPSPDP